MMNLICAAASAFGAWGSLQEARRDLRLYCYGRIQGEPFHYRLHRPPYLHMTIALLIIFLVNCSFALIFLFYAVGLF